MLGLCYVLCIFSRVDLNVLLGGDWIPVPWTVFKPPNSRPFGVTVKVRGLRMSLPQVYYGVMVTRTVEGVV